MKKILLLLVILLTLSSCQKSEIAPDKIEVPESEMVIYHVGMDQTSGTRTALTSEYKVAWSEGDMMNLFCGVNNTKKDKLVLLEGAGTLNGSFYGPYIAVQDEAELHQTVIVYPYDENNTCVANEDKTEYTVGLTIPAVQQYTQGSFENGVSPMIGVTQNVKEVVIATKNISSLISLELLGDKKISKIVFSAEDMALAGPSEVVAAYGQDPVTTVVEATASNSVELVCGEGVQLNTSTATPFIIALAPCYGKITVTIYDTEGGYMSKTTKETDFARNLLMHFNLTYTPENSVVDDLKNAFKNGGEYTLPIDVEVTEQLIIEGGKELYLDLNGKTLTTSADLSGTNGCIHTKGAALHIENGKIVSKSSGYLFGTNAFKASSIFELTDVDVVSKAIMMAIGGGTNTVFTNVNADLRGDGFYYSYGSIDSSLSGILIDGGKYKVADGKVTFKNIANKIPVNFVGNCLFSENSFTGVEWMDSGDADYPYAPKSYTIFIGSMGYYTLDAAVAAVEESATIELRGNITLEETVTIPAGKTITLDLGGYTISQAKECTGSYSMINNKGSLTITGDGKISFEDLSDGGGSSWGSYIINNYGELVVENGIIEHLGTADDNHDTSIPIQNYAGKVIVNGGTISSPEFRSLRDFTAGGEIIINGGTFAGQVWMQGLGNGSSSLTINGGSFSPTEGYDGSSVYITNGSNDVILSITGGTFNTKIGCAVPSKEGVKGKVKGGIFTETAKVNTNANLIAEGYIFESQTDGTYYLIPAFVKVSDTEYEVYNLKGLELFRDQVNEGNSFAGMTIKLATDLDLKNEEWTPIGFNSNEEVGNEPYFSGTFDGKNYTISNLKIDVTDKGGVGFFGAVHNATFKNFTLNNVDIKAIESENNPANSSGAEGKPNYIVGGHIGAVAGYDAQTGAISFNNVHVTGLIKIEGETRAAQGQRIGGIFGGRSSSSVEFNDVSVSGSDGSYIKGYCSTAGVMGQTQGAGTFTNVHTDIDIHAVTFGAGGIIGIARYGSTFNNCSSAGDITLDASKTQLSSYSANYPYRVGGIAGCWSEGGAGEITLASCSYTGSLESIDRDGNTPEAFDYAGYVGRGFGLKGCQGSAVTIDGVSYVQAFDEAANSGVYYINDELIINSAANLKVLATKVNSGNHFAGIAVKLTNDIDLKNEEWTPIGTSSNKFQGTFDGQGYTISNLSITGNNSNVGLFGFTTSGEIKNLTVNNAKVSGYLNVAVVAGTPYTSKYTNINVTGHVEVNGFAYVGTIGGKNAYADWNYITVNVDETSYVKANSIEGETNYRTYVGGVCGFNGEGGHSFKNITSNIDVTGTTCDVGGLFGIAHYGNKFENCSSSGDVKITSGTSAGGVEQIGGIAGVWHNGGSDVVFTNCSFTGALTTNITEGVDLSDNTIVGNPYNTTGNGRLIINGEVVQPKQVENFNYSNETF